MEQQRLYRSHAELYDLIYDYKDYEAEAREITALLQRQGVPEGSRVLEAACGTGRFLHALKPSFAVAGFDLNEGVLAIARQRLPGVPLWQADMASFSVDSPYDALLCLFSSVGYLQTEEALVAAARCFHAALRPGGTLFIQPWLEPRAYEPGTPHMQTYDSPDIKVVRCSNNSLDDQLSVIHFHWLVSRRGQQVEHMEEIHHLRLTPAEQMLDLLDAAGFEARFHEGAEGSRGSYLARRR